MRRPVFALSLTLLCAVCGCSLCATEVDREVNHLDTLVQAVDTRPATDLAPPPPAEPETAPPSAPTVPPSAPPVERSSEGLPAPDGRPQPVAFFQVEKQPPRRLVVPPGLPGANVPPITKFPENAAERKRYLAEMFPPLPPAPEMKRRLLGPEGRPMTLSDLQRLAASYSPTIKTAEAAVEAAKGAVKQAGVYPNPNVFFEQDTVGTGSGGYEGFGFNQTIKTGNKLKLQQAAAMIDYVNAKVALKRAYLDLAYQVRTNYFAVLVALAGVRSNEALYQFTNEIYRVQVELVEGTIAAPYEPLQLRALAIQARFNLVQSQNQYLASWRQLAAAIGLRDMPPTELAGRVDMPVPTFQYNEVLVHMLTYHTDVVTANNAIQKARFNLEFAKVTPIPDVGFNVLVQKDYTAPPNGLVHSLQVSLPMPVWDQNLGNIKQAEALLIQAKAGPEQARNALVTSLADAWNRYVTNRENVQISLQQVRDQIRAYRALYDRRQSDPTAVGFGDVVTAQQTLAGYIATYIAALGLQWTAVCDVANLLQTEDLFAAGPREEMAPVPDLRTLTPPTTAAPSPPASRKGATP